jgi:hypothetical protein
MKERKYQMRTKKLKIGPVVSIALLMMVTFFFRPSPVGGTPVVWTDKGIYDQGEMITVMFSNSPGNDSDWICIVPAGSPDTDGGDYKYMPKGLGQGSLIFEPRSPGEYEVRAYYNYRRNGYVVSGRYAFSVAGDPAEEEASAQGMEPIDPYSSPETNLPPTITFVAPPEVIVIPETNVYVVPDTDEDLFFWDSWWWRLWKGRWYRSHDYNRGWAYYNNVPSFYFDVDPGWRGYYKAHNWYGHRWNYERIPNLRLQQNWKTWQSNRHWERQRTWGVQNYQPRPQQQRQQLRQQRQQQYQQRPEVQKQRRPQAQQPRQQVQQPVQQPQAQHQQPRQRVQQPVQQPQVQQPVPRPQAPQPLQQPQVQQPRQQAQQPIPRPQAQQPLQQPQVQQPRQQAQQQQHSQPQGPGGDPGKPTTKGGPGGESGGGHGKPPLRGFGYDNAPNPTGDK